MRGEDFLSVGEEIATPLIAEFPRSPLSRQLRQAFYSAEHISLKEVA